MLQAVFTKNVNKIEVSGLTQWDYGQKLEITLAGLPESFEAHFAYRGATEAPVVKGTAVDGVATVPIPNILTTQKNDAVCWLYYKDGESGETVKTILLPIKARQKPTDYVYTETEVVSYTSLLKRVEELENNGASDDAIASAVAKWLEKNPIESGTSDAVQYISQTLTEEQQTQARTNIGAASAKEVGRLSATVNDLKDNETGSGVTTAMSESLWAIIQKTAFAEQLTDAELTAFKTAWGITEEEPEEPDTPIEPDVPEVTLSSISATYTGGDVTVGTALTELTGITVTGTYSDGSTSAITGYSLSGEIVEGNNTITVIYNGLTTTFTVTGVAEEEDENNGWEADVAYELTWTDDYSLDSSTGAETSSSGKSVSNYIPVLGASALIGNASIYGSYLYAYDSEKNYLGRVNYSSTLPCSINRNVAYIRVLATTANKTSVVIYPVVYDVLTENTAWENGKYYIPTYNPQTGVNANTGAVSSNATWWASGHTFCYGATTLNIMTYYERRKTVVFYDSDKNYISGSTGNNVTFTIPENAHYFIVSMYDGFEYKIQSPNRPWATLT